MEIKVLKMFIDTVSKDRYHFLSPPEVYLADKHSPKVLQLYKLIKDEKVKTDEEAMQALYPLMPLPKEYKKIKEQLIDKVEVLLLGVDPDKILNTMIAKAIFYTARRFFVASIIKQSKHLEFQAGDWYKRTLSSAQPFGINAFTMPSYFTLSELSAFLNKPEEWLEYKLAFEKELEYYIAEKKLRLLYHELILIMFSSESAIYKNIKRVKKYYDEAKKIGEKFSSFPIKSVIVDIGVRYAQGSRNPSLLLEIVSSYEELLTQFPENRNKRILVFCASLRMEAHMLLREYDLGRLEVKQNIKHFTPGTYDWLAFLEYYFLLCMHAKNYDQALNIYYEVIKNEYFPNLNLEFQERWKYFEPYLNYLLPEQFPKEAINLLGFLDEISYYTHHKADNNITIMIGQIIIMLEMRVFDQLSARTRYLEQYIDKYIDKKIYPRSIIFLKIIVQLFKNNFDAELTESQTKKTFEKLLPVNGNKLFSPEGIEVIPYDHLWPMILDKLKKKNAE